MNVFAPQAPNDSRKVVRSFNEDGSANFKQVGVEELSYRGRYGALVTSSTENEISIGDKYFVLDYDTDQFRVGDDVLIIAGDPDCFMWGEVVDKDTVYEPARLRIFVDDVSALTGTYTQWELQVVARPKPGIEKDTSLTEFDPTDGGPWTLTVTAGKFFPPTGTLLLKPTTDRTIAVIGEVRAYNGTDLTVSLRATNATTPTNYDSWSIALLDAPPAAMPILSIVGMQIDTDALVSDHEITVLPGSVMDSAGTVLLTIESAITKIVDGAFTAGDGENGVVRTSALAGTIGSSGSTVTGSGTAFETDFTDAGNLTDYAASGGEQLLGSVISNNSRSNKVVTVTSNTSLTTSSSPFFGGGGSAYYRGGWFAVGQQGVGDGFAYFVLVIRSDATGAIDVCFVSATPSGTPDLPSGYSVYRCIGVVTFTANGTTTIANVSSEQHLYTSNQPFAPKSRQYVVVGSIDNLPNGRALISSTSVIAKTETGTPNQVRLDRAALTGDVTATENSNATTIASAAITGKTEKTTPVSGDMLLLADSEASFALKKVDFNNIGGSGGITMGKAIAAAIVFG